MSRYMIDENSLLEHLLDHERELIFGKSIKNRNIKLVHLRHLTDADEVAVSNTKGTARPVTIEENATQTPSRRVKRADSASSAEQLNGAQPRQEVSIQIQDNEHLVNLKLRQTPKLIDDAFIFIRRYANSTQFIENSHKLAEKYERCFYSNENSALDLCDDENVRGVFNHNSTDYIIHPLPARFGNSTHIILEKSDRSPSDPDILPISITKSIVDSNIQFEPDRDEFNDLNIINISQEIDVEETSRPTRNTEHYGQEQRKNRYNKQPQHKYLHSSQNKSFYNYQQLPQHLSFRPRYQNDYHFHNIKSRQHSNKHKHQKQLNNAHHHNHSHHYHQQQHQQQHKRHKTRRRRNINQWIPKDLHIETAIFVDRELYKHMAKNYPKNTESHVMRFVLAMINAVQLLYHHPTLERRINFVLKRLEILYVDPKNLTRSSDIDTYLSNFCMWQSSLNPISDDDPKHFDHAVILTGLDLYVLDKKTGKSASQVVGLAPVSGMCLPESSCTVNEGKHFDSVYVVAHEIGHNLGMRHDSNEKSCDPNTYIMSPTLGSGKTTWSKCSREYLNIFLKLKQSKCLFDRGQFINNLDHSAEGMLPGERFDASQQCMLKYGVEAERALSQEFSDVCRDLHCQRDRYTWTSHPALEGTECGLNMWCRNGVCVKRSSLFGSSNAPREYALSSKLGYEKSNFLESNKMGHLMQDYNYNKLPIWSEWGEASECDSGCLFGSSNRLLDGSTGLKTFTRSCLNYRRRCSGRDRKFESCAAKLCHSIAITTIDAFATEICEKANKFDSDLTGVGQQIVGDFEESCKVFCKTKSNGTKSRSWLFPDGTTCKSSHYSPNDISYCIAGRCEKFSCDNSTNNYYKLDAKFCQRPPQPAVENETNRISNYNTIQTQMRYAERERDIFNRNNINRDPGRFYGSTNLRNKYENEVAVRNSQQEQYYRAKSEPYQQWNKYNYHHSYEQPSMPVSASLVSATVLESEWIVKSGCHSSCIANSKGVQVVTSRRTGVRNIQLCTHKIKPCERLLTPAEFAENTCSRYKLKVRGLSGHGTQIAASINEPDRSCRVGCQDEFIKYRFYLVNGKYGHFPLGTKCSNTEERYCVNGKCLEFGPNNIPQQQSHISLALFRNRRSVDSKSIRRHKRSFLYYDPVNITETLTQDFINNIVNSIIAVENTNNLDENLTDDHIEFTNPIHISTDELNME
ncbi:uncharacterized protein LOC119675069 [Teleopsis dalmanni]|uniref:uncharacterized protein LOC119675069 n=1 Tax=Teleopsis dalmanni TaxID=139649 RepID=UPI0018CC9DE0|nr:uncharacterized protein LOC119675069 [Teleopsis dalmanni]